ncbi:MAG: NUDIX hydrolase [Alphaproteobacteria bacterium]
MTAAAPTAPGIEIGLIAAIIGATDDEPVVLAVSDRGQLEDRRGNDGLPFGPFNPVQHRTFEVGLRSWVHKQTALDVGHVEQLYTFGDRGRQARQGDATLHQVSVGYLALTRATDQGSDALARVGASWRRWYDYFPWEDWRDQRPAVVDVLVPALAEWANQDPDRKLAGQQLGRRERLAIAFGHAGTTWDDERVLDRYELLYEAGLIAESARDGHVIGGEAPGAMGRSMRFDHRRILATAISRLRAKLKYRPVIFELMADEFTLSELQHMAEALSGRRLHQQNFRRLVETAALVEPTGATRRQNRGRPAALFRFRREILQERNAPGLRLGVRS